MIQLSNISKEIGDRLLFEEVTFSLEKGEKVGLIGRNGSGKSTLFKIIAGLISSDDGKITTPSNYSVGYLEQNLNFNHESVFKECQSALKEDEKFDDYKVEAILQGLGFEKEDIQKDPNIFSGGYQIRISLAKLLLENNDLLLLDEPTNYLDIESVLWFKRFLSRFSGEVVLITHDRDFMNSVCNSTIGLARRTVEKVKGSTDKYFEFMKAKDELYQSQMQNQEKKKKELEAFITRFKAKASKATAAQSRQKMLDKMQEFEELEDPKNLSFRFNYCDFPSKNVIEIKNLSFGYNPDEILFNDLNFYINKGDRVAIIGKNGKGKSTLLNLIRGSLSPVTGEVKLNHNVKLGYFGQTHIESLSPELSIVDEIKSTNADLDNSKIRSICGAMMFSGDDAKKKISVLSGGEKSRVLIGKLLAQETNLLLLDEPTNHLDQESVEELVASLKDFDGASIVVTHSEHILRALPNKFIVFQKGGALFFEGSYDYFLEKIGWEEKEDSGSNGEEKTKLTKKEIRDLREEIIKRRAKSLKPLEKKLALVESKIEELENHISQLNEKLMNASTDSSIDLAKVSIDHGKISKELEEVMEEYEVLFEEVDTLSTTFEEELQEIGS